MGLAGAAAVVVFARALRLARAVEGVVARAPLLLGGIVLARHLALAFVLARALALAFLLALAFGELHPLAFGRLRAFAIDLFHARALALAFAIALHRHCALARVGRLQFGRAGI